MTKELSLYKKLRELSKGIAEANNSYTMGRNQYVAEVAGRFRMRADEVNKALREIEKMKLVKRQGQRRIRIL